MGTGNDLARTLGYGAGGDVTDVKDLLRDILKLTIPTTLDRWKVTLTPKKRFGQKKTLFMQNYFSIGVDALVTYNFHKTRENKSIPFSGRIFNKLIYFFFGTKDVLER